MGVDREGVKAEGASQWSCNHPDRRKPSLDGSGGGVEMRTRCNLGNYFMISFLWLVPKYLFIFPFSLSPPYLLPCPYTISTLRDMHTLLKCKQTKFILTNETLVDYSLVSLWSKIMNKDPAVNICLTTPPPPPAVWMDLNPHRATGTAEFPTRNILYKVPSTGPGIPTQTFHFCS